MKKVPTLTHPFGSFVPPKAKYLILGSFPSNDPSCHWFYGSRQNQFWTILESVYQQPLATISQQKKLLSRLGFATTDIIYQCQRQKSNSSDTNLVNLVYHTKLITKIIARNPIKKIFFTSRFVETKFKTVFKNLIADNPHLKLVTLPSPSPRYASLSLVQKIKRYQKCLPSLSA